MLSTGGKGQCSMASTSRSRVREGKTCQACSPCSPLIWTTSATWVRRRRRWRSVTGSSHACPRSSWRSRTSRPACRNRTGGVLVVWSTWTISAVMSRRGRLLTMTRGYSTGPVSSGTTWPWTGCRAAWSGGSASKASAIACWCARMGSTIRSSPLVSWWKVALIAGSLLVHLFCRPSRRPEYPGHRRRRTGHSAGASIAEAVRFGSVTAAMVSWRLLARRAWRLWHGLQREWLTNQRLDLGLAQTMPLRRLKALRRVGEGHEVKRFPEERASANHEARRVVFDPDERVAGEPKGLRDLGRQAFGHVGHQGPR